MQVFDWVVWFSKIPLAAHSITQADYDFWTDQQKVGEKFKVFWETASKNLAPNRDRIHFIRDGEEFLPGIQAILAPGHTVGYTIFMITSGNQQLCYIGDLAHHPVLLFEHR
jgi:glyoxylase-like metal-dependent hydrolase (beta-lactamase superfamily II)